MVVESECVEEKIMDKLGTKEIRQFNAILGAITDSLSIGQGVYGTKKDDIPNAGRLIGRVALAAARDTIVVTLGDSIRNVAYSTAGCAYNVAKKGGTIQQIAYVDRQLVIIKIIKSIDDLSDKILSTPMNSTLTKYLPMIPMVLIQIIIGYTHLHLFEDIDKIYNRLLALEEFQIVCQR